MRWSGGKSLSFPSQVTTTPSIASPSPLGLLTAPLSSFETSFLTPSTLLVRSFTRLMSRTDRTSGIAQRLKTSFCKSLCGRTGDTKKKSLSRRLTSAESTKCGLSVRRGEPATRND